jgi:3-oxocholest-4-en-26-oate---CoA ligase
MSGFNLADLFEKVAVTVPQREALVAGARRLDYGELDRRSNRLASHWLARGIMPGQHIAILSFNRAEWIEAMLAAFKLRAVPININFRYVEEELRYMLDNADVVALVYERQFTPRLLAIRDSLPQLRHLLALDDGHVHALDALDAEDYETALSAASEQALQIERSQDDIYMLYTGGTTGMPKGTMWRHEDIFFGAMQGGAPGGEPIRAPDEIVDKVLNGFPLVTVCPAPMMHGGGMWTAMITLLSGGRFVLYCEPSFDGERILQLVRDEGALSVMLVGDAMARPFAEAQQKQRLECPSLFVVSSAGAILSKPVKNLLKELFPAARILDGFGASETGHNGAVVDFDGEAAGPRFTFEPHTRILDDSLDPVAPGSDTIGRLARRGHIPLGYYKDAKKTAETFQTDRHGVRWVIPGDHARVLADGTVELLGRGSMCINSGGEKIFPEEVEAVLKGHPAIFDAVVVGVPDARFTNAVCAVAQLRPGMQTTLEDVARYCEGKLARYKLPRHLLFSPAIARTPPGKPDYRANQQFALRELGLG